MTRVTQQSAQAKLAEIIRLIREEGLVHSNHIARRCGLTTQCVNSLIRRNEDLFERLGGEGTRNDPYRWGIKPTQEGK